MQYIFVCLCYWTHREHSNPFNHNIALVSWWTYNTLKLENLFNLNSSEVLPTFPLWNTLWRRLSAFCSLWRWHSICQLLQSHLQCWQSTENTYGIATPYVLGGCQHDLNTIILAAGQQQPPPPAAYTPTLQVGVWYSQLSVAEWLLSTMRWTRS